jgi:hypothetical protein
MDKPVASSVLQAMADAYPDRLDAGLLAMVIGCRCADVESAMKELQAGRLAHDDATITEGGMAMASGRAQPWESPEQALHRLEAHTLRELMCKRVAASRLQPRQRRELRESIDKTTGESLVGAAKIWAYRPVADWAAFIQGLGSPVEPSGAT